MDYVNNIIIHKGKKNIHIYDRVYLQLYQFVNKHNKIILAQIILY